MFNAGLDPASATDTQLPDYADFYVEYSSSTRAVTKEVAAVCSSCVGGGTNSDVFTYATSSNANGYNSWKVRTTVTLD
jgi:hypothetical protein